jgi:hypothetical protein
LANSASGEFLQHLGLGHPVLVQLRRQLDEVAQHLGAGQALVFHAAQQAVQAMAELVEQRAHVVEAEQRRLPCRAAREVVVVQDDGRGAQRAALVAQRVHPGAAALGRTREVVLQEQAAQAPVGVEDLVGAHIGVVAGDIGPGLEAQAEQPSGAVEHRGHHAVQREIGLDLGLVQLEAGAPGLLGVEAPVPGLELVRGAGRGHGPQHGLALARLRRQRRLPDALQQVHDGTLAARHGVLQRIVGIAGMAMQPGCLGAQLEDLAAELAVVGVAAVAAAHPGPPGLLAQVAAGAEGQEGQDEGARQRDDVDAFVQPAVDGGLAGGRAHETGQAGQLGLGRQAQLVAALGRQHVLREARVQLGQAGHDGGIAFARRGRQAGAGAQEVQVHALQQPALLGRQAQPLALLEQRVDAREQALVHVDGAAMLGQRRGQRALGGLQLGRGGRRGQRVEQMLQSRQPAATGVEGGDGVGEAGRLGLRGDRVDLGTVLGQGGVKSGLEMRRLNVGKGRQAMRAGPILQQRVAHAGAFWRVKAKRAASCRRRPVIGRQVAARLTWPRRRPFPCARPSRRSRRRPCSCTRPTTCRWRRNAPRCALPAPCTGLPARPPSR